MAHTRASVVIVGAGIGGLTTALTLRANGIPDVLVLEAASEIRPLGVGINIQPAAVAVLSSLDLDVPLAASGIATRELRYVDRAGRALWAEARGLAAGERHPQYSIHRGELQMLLLESVRSRLRADAVRTGARLVSFEQTHAGVRVLAHDRGAGKMIEIEADALIGADGIHSTVRAQLHPDKCSLVFSNVHMWRGMTELDDFLDGCTMIVANDEQSSRLIAYPISAERARAGRVLVNWVCMVPGARTASSAEADWNSRGKLEDVLPYFGNWHFGWLDVKELLSQSDQILQYPMVDRDPLDFWGVGRATLLGDAAHLMYPVGANGASQAILDATSLAAELASHDDIVEALQAYEANRRAPTSAVIQANRARDRAERAMVSRPDSEKQAALAAITQEYRTIVERR
jgi:2-polyprenyl-6-methoxyphenol hydroxylase-like FAD-dependent oxidoreductase